MKKLFDDRVIIAVAVVIAVMFMAYALVDFFAGDQAEGKTTTTTVGWCPKADRQELQRDRIEAKLDCLGERP